MTSSYEYKQQLDSMKAPEFSSANYFEQSFVDRIKKAQQNIDDLVSKENQANSRAQESQDAFDTFKGEMRHYSDISEEKENEFGVKTAMNNYNQSKNAIAATQAAINALPSTINANSNRVLTQSQRTAAYQTQFANYNRAMGIETRAVSEYEKTWERARENALKASANEYVSQQEQYTNLSNAWNSAMQEWNTAQNNVLQARTQMSNIESQYRTWQHKQYMRELELYLAKRENLNKEYLAQLSNETAMEIQRLASQTSRLASNTQQSITESNYRRQQINEKYYNYAINRGYNNAYQASSGGGGGSW